MYGKIYLKWQEGTEAAHHTLKNSVRQLMTPSLVKNDLLSCHLLYTIMKAIFLIFKLGFCNVVHEMKCNDLRSLLS